MGAPQNGGQTYKLHNLVLENGFGPNLSVLVATLKKIVILPATKRSDIMLASTWAEERTKLPECLNDYAALLRDWSTSRHIRHQRRGLLQALRVAPDGWGGINLMWSAVVHGHTDLVSAALDAGIRPDEPRHRGKTMLLEVCSILATEQIIPAGRNPTFAAAYEDIVEWLLWYGADPNFVHTEERDSFLRGPAKYRSTPLFQAASAGNVRVLDCLLEYGADVNSYGSFYDSALTAAVVAKNTAAACLLIDAGSELSRRYCNQPLIWYLAHEQKKYAGSSASSDGEEEGEEEEEDHDDDEPTNSEFVVLSKLLAAHAERGTLSTAVNERHHLHGQPGADPNEGTTPLHEAAASGCGATVAMLLVHGANPYATAKAMGPSSYCNGHTPLHVSRNRTVAGKLIAAAPGTVHSRNELGFTPLLLAAQLGDVAFVELLVGANADVNVRTWDVGFSPATTPLHVAAERLEEGVVCALLEAGASVNVNDGMGRSALLVATSNEGRTETKSSAGVLKLLIAANADAHARHRCWSMADPEAPEDSFQRVFSPQRLAGYSLDWDDTPLFAAAESLDSQALEVLLEAGATLEASNCFVRRDPRSCSGDSCERASSLRTITTEDPELVSPLFAALTVEDNGYPPKRGTSADCMRVLLRAGADPHAIFARLPSPFQLAEAWLQRNAWAYQHTEIAISAARLVSLAGQGWSPASHHLMPANLRPLALEYLRLGYELVRDPRIGEPIAFIDVWKAVVMPLCLGWGRLGYRPHVVTGTD
jgi:ankyrin repeat protein